MDELDELTAAFAEYAEKNREQGRVITQEVLRERCRHYLDVAKQELQECGPDPSTDFSRFEPRVAIFGPLGEEARNVGIGFKNGAEKYARMQALSNTCRALLVQAVVLRMVGVAVNAEKVAQRLGLNIPDNAEKARYFNDRMRKWMEKEYHTQRYAGLPPEFRTDSLMVTGIGPKLEDWGIAVKYHWDNGKLVFGDTTHESSTVRLDMVPRWWQ